MLDCDCIRGCIWGMGDFTPEGGFDHALLCCLLEDLKQFVGLRGSVGLLHMSHHKVV
jgi:hypothetical protein